MEDEQTRKSRASDEDSDKADQEAPVEAPSSAAPVAPAPAAPEPDWQDRYLRALAELENYRARTERDRAAQSKYASEPVIRKLLEPIDSLDRALVDLEALLRESPETIRAPLSRSLDGLKALRRQFHALLDSEGVVSFGEEGAPFDPAVHEALLKVPSEALPEGAVAQVLQPGYMLRGRVVRPARVSVSSGPPEPERPSDELHPRDKAPKHGIFGKRNSSPEANPPGHSNHDHPK